MAHDLELRKLVVWEGIYARDAYQALSSKRNREEAKHKQETLQRRSGEVAALLVSISLTNKSSRPRRKPGYFPCVPKPRFESPMWVSRC